MICFLSDLSQVLVWIIGDETILAAQKRAAIRNFSEFQFENYNVNLCWFFFETNDINNLYSFIFNLVSDYSSPNILILHFGSGFIGRIRTLKLIAELKQVLFRIHSFLINTILVFSEILPRLLWSHRLNFFMEKIRKRVNRSISNFLLSLNGISFRHYNLEGFLPGYYLTDEFSFSPVGLDIFNLDVQSMLEVGLQCFGGPRHV